VHFRTPDHLIMGSPLRTGLPIVVGDPTGRGVNMFRPKFAALLIRLAKKRGWAPEQQTQPFVVEDEGELLAQLREAICRQ
jgi:hypothetical protein